MSAEGRKDGTVSGYFLASDSARMRGDSCPRCGKPVRWVRESGGEGYNTDCRNCMVVWHARLSSVIFEITGRVAVLSQFGAMVFPD